MSATPSPPEPEVQPLRVVLTIHHALDRATGAPGVTLALAEAFTELGHDVEVIGFDGLWVRDDRLRRLVFPGVRRGASLGPASAAADRRDRLEHGRHGLVVLRSSWSAARVDRAQPWLGTPYVRERARRRAPRT